MTTRGPGADSALHLTKAWDRDRKTDVLRKRRVNAVEQSGERGGPLGREQSTRPSGGWKPIFLRKGSTPGSALPSGEFFFAHFFGHSGRDDPEPRKIP